MVAVDGKVQCLSPSFLPSAGLTKKAAASVGTQRYLEEVVLEAELQGLGHAATFVVQGHSLLDHVLLLAVLCGRDHVGLAGLHGQAQHLLLQASLLCQPARRPRRQVNRVCLAADCAGWRGWVREN